MHFIILAGGVFLVFIISVYYLNSITKLTEYESRLKALNKLVKKNSTPSAYIARADFYFKHLEYNLALVNYEKAIELAPAELDGHIKKVNTLKMLDRTEDLEEAYRAMINRCSSKANAMILRAFYHLRVGRFAEAGADYEQALAYRLTKIQRRDYFIIKGLNNYHLGDLKMAVENFNEAINVINYMSSPYILKFITFKREGQKNRVLSNFNQFKIYCEESRNSHYILKGDYFSEIDEVENAIYNYRRPLNDRLKEEEPHKFYYSKARIAQLEGREREASKYYDQIIGCEYPEVIRGILDAYLYHIYIAKSLAYFNNKELALEELKKLEEKPDYYHTLKLYLDDVRDNL